MDHLETQAMFAVADLPKSTRDDGLLIKLQQLNSFSAIVTVFREANYHEKILARAAKQITVSKDYVVSGKVDYFVVRKSWFPWFHRCRVGNLILQRVPDIAIKRTGTVVRHYHMLLEPKKKV